MVLKVFSIYALPRAFMTAEVISYLEISFNYFNPFDSIVSHALSFCCNLYLMISILKTEKLT